MTLKQQSENAEQLGNYLIEKNTSFHSVKNKDIDILCERFEISRVLWGKVFGDYSYNEQVFRLRETKRLNKLKKCTK